MYSWLYPYKTVLECSAWKPLSSTTTRSSPSNLWTSVETTRVPADRRGWRYRAHTHTRKSSAPIYLFKPPTRFSAQDKCSEQGLEMEFSPRTTTTTHRHESTVTINIWPCPGHSPTWILNMFSPSPRLKWPPSDTLQNYSSYCHITVALSQNREWVLYAGFSRVLIKTVKFQPHGRPCWNVKANDIHMHQSEVINLNGSITDFY